MPLWAVFLSVWATMKFVFIFTDWFSAIKSASLGGQVYTEYVITGARQLFSLLMSFHKKNKKIHKQLDKAGDRIFGIIKT
jgi:hypothetical protein